MEDRERKKIEELSKKDYRLRRLYENHKKLEARLASFHSRRFLLSDEEVECNSLKRKKLEGVDEMMRILAESSEEAAA